jgi:hypothetical protein
MAEPAGAVAEPSVEQQPTHPIQMAAMDSMTLAAPSVHSMTLAPPSVHSGRQLSVLSGKQARLSVAESQLSLHSGKQARLSVAPTVNRSESQRASISGSERARTASALSSTLPAGWDASTSNAETAPHTVATKAPPAAAKASASAARGGSGLPQHHRRHMHRKKEKEPVDDNDGGAAAAAAKAKEAAHGKTKLSAMKLALIHRWIGTSDRGTTVLGPLLAPTDERGQAARARAKAALLSAGQPLFPLPPRRATLSALGMDKKQSVVARRSYVQRTSCVASSSAASHGESGAHNGASSDTNPLHGDYAFAAASKADDADDSVSEGALDGQLDIIEICRATTDRGAGLEAPAVDVVLTLQSSMVLSAGGAAGIVQAAVHLGDDGSLANNGDAASAMTISVSIDNVPTA